MSAPSVHEHAPETWWSRSYGLIWMDTDERAYQLVDGGRVVERFTLPADAVTLYEGPPCCCGECEVVA